VLWKDSFHCQRRYVHSKFFYTCGQEFLEARLNNHQASFSLTLTYSNKNTIQVENQMIVTHPQQRTFFLQGMCKKTKSCCHFLHITLGKTRSGFIVLTTDIHQIYNL
jgi:hypothetical protein